MLKILHTSDWHLGQSFMGKSREEEHKKFFNWLLEVIEKEHISLLIVAGDIFDTATPPNYALELYYNFLTKLSQSSCSNIILIAGNHDSIAMLKASQKLLKALNIYLIASGDMTEEEIVPIYEYGRLEGVVCAVPFLRDYVVRKSIRGQTFDEKESALTWGIKEHYRRLYRKAKEYAEGKNIPIIATGHLTTTGAKRVDSEREIYVGAKVAIEANFLSERFDYVALGHLHTNQKVDYDNIRYCGAPIPLSFGEAMSQKKVNIVTFNEKRADVHEVAIPLFRQLLVLRGKTETILKRLEEVTQKESWIEVYVNDDNPFYANKVIREKAGLLGVTLLAVKIEKNIEPSYQRNTKPISLDELTPLELFKKRLEKEQIEDERLYNGLITHFKEIVSEVQKR